MPHRRLNALGAIVLFLAIIGIIGIFGQTLTFGMVDLDDAEHILANPFVASPSWQGLRQVWAGPYFKLYIPMTYTAWAAIHGLAEWLNPRLHLPPYALFHAANLLAHGINTLLVFYILRHFKIRSGAAAAAALVFAIHPLQVESVAWISGFKDVFSGTLSLTSLFLLVRYVERRAWLDFWLSSLFFAAALLAKPTAATIPLMAAMLMMSLDAKRDRRRLAGLLALWALMACGMVFYTMKIQPAADLPFVVKPLDRLLIAADALIFYGTKVVLPLRLGFDYGMTPDFVLKHHPTFWALGAIVGWSLLLAKHPKWRPVRMPLGLFLCALLPSLGLIPYYYQAISTTADRYIYLGMLGPALGIGLVCEALAAKSWHRMAYSLGVVALLGLGVLSYRQVSLWRDTITIARHTLEVNPRSWLAHHILGGALVKGGDLEEGTYHLKKTVSMRPWFPDAYYNLGVVAQMQGDLPGAARSFRSAVQYEPKDGQAWFDLAKTLTLLDQGDEALRAFAKALTLRPQSSDWMAAWGRAKLRWGDLEGGIVLLQKAADLGHRDPMTEAAWGEALLRLGRDPAALEHLKWALDQGSRDASLLANYGLAQLRLGHLESAEGLLKEALAQEPDALMAMFNLGLVYKKKGQWSEARELWTRVLALRPDFAPAQKALRQRGKKDGVEGASD